MTPGMTVLVAVSGGPDSMALLHVMARLAPRLGVKVVAHGVDHGLRPEALGELELAQGLAHNLRIPMGITRVEVAPGGNLQARAREARYRALREAAQVAGAQRIATGHHADDRAETVLMRLLQGSGLRGLGCLPARQGELIRPFLRARRQDVIAHLVRHRIVAAQDPSNNDARFLRTRVRSEVMPLLETLSPAVVTHLNDLANDLLTLNIQRDLPERGRGQRRQIEGARRAGRQGIWLREAGGREVWVAVAGEQVMLREQKTNSPSDVGDSERSSTAGQGGGKLAEMARSTGEASVGPAKVRS
ncbi:MAG: tRNA lysidine(34) synthetase TilS [Polyangiaceae bacterium]|nr:tRNA lysidine(34) synthetase TilS [Polyangiaceae bacterium]